MRKPAEQEHQLKLAIRDEVARNSLVSVLQLQERLKKHGFHDFMKHVRGIPGSPVAHRFSRLGNSY